MHELRLTLPLPPSQNHAYRRHTVTYNADGRTKHRTMNVLTKKADRWQSDAHDAAYQEMCRTGWTCPQGEKVTVDIVVLWPDKRRRDTHNLLKLLMDALEGVAYDDDRWALPRILDFDYDRADPRVEVVVRRAA